MFDLFENPGLRLPRDRAMELSWRLFLSLLICAVACVSVMLAYFAFFSLISANWTDGAAQLAIALSLAAGAAWLCYNRNDLVGAV